MRLPNNSRALGAGAGSGGRRVVHFLVSGKAVQIVEIIINGSDAPAADLIVEFVGPPQVS